MAGPAALHFAFETLGYFTGVSVYTVQRRRRGDAISDGARIDVLIGAALGAAIGSRLLFWFCDPRLTLANLMNLHYLFGGKTIVGGFLGGLMGVELAKKIIGVRESTGDLLAFALLAATAIGRIGCFLAGPADHTAGLPTSLPWGIAMGDGVRRHPVALYEIVFLVFVLAPVLHLVHKRERVAGDVFRVFLASYLAWRLAVDFLKPDPPRIFAGLSAIQWACLCGLVYYATVFARRTDDRTDASLSFL